MKKLIIIGLSLLYITGIYAQEISSHVISSAGNKHIINSISFEWTLGELSIMTLQGTHNIITQGFHQPNYVITNISKPSTDIGKIKVYPNPTTNLVQIEMTFNKIRAVYARLTDMNGKLIWDNEYEGQQIIESESLKNYPNGSYLLNLFIDKGKSKQTFIIQKNN